MSEPTNETTIANLRETLARVTAERDTYREALKQVRTAVLLCDNVIHAASAKRFADQMLAEGW